MVQHHAVSSIGQLQASMRRDDEIVTGLLIANVTAARCGRPSVSHQLLL
ncbi:hypothetical protein PG5_64160 [Pseudomonas sp. G5(2012)]|nr:hypothetical protein PG5_64160 [Pseudomonas sp. G5(2012)]